MEPTMEPTMEERMGAIVWSELSIIVKLSVSGGLLKWATFARPQGKVDPRMGLGLRRKPFSLYWSTPLLLLRQLKNSKETVPEKEISKFPKGSTIIELNKNLGLKSS